MTDTNTGNIDKKNNILAAVKEIAETIVTVLILIIVIRNFIGEPRWIPSASMRPTLLEGDRIWIEKISGFYSAPKRGDIVVFYPPTEYLSKTPWAKFTRLIGFFNNDIAYIKRIIGVPGDVIEVKDGSKGGFGVYINGKPLKEPYKQELSTRLCTEGMYCGPMTVPKNSYFMMGDNRSNSQDSRYWGFLPKNRVIGKACFRFWPINRIGILGHPKYDLK